VNDHALLLALTFHLPAIVTAYAVMSAVTFIVYFLDKARAIRGRWRVSEWTLHLLELCFGWPGALVAQRFFRHKLYQRHYMVVFWLIVLVHAAFWGWYFGWLGA